MADGPPAPASLAAIVDTLVDEAIADYRIVRPTARELVEEALRNDLKLRAAAAKESDIDRLRRTRAFRNARKTARKKIYYTLRQYKRGKGEAPGADLPSLTQALAAAEDPAAVEHAAGEILAAHSSTRERLVSWEAFDDGLLRGIGQPRSVLDVGCGVYPLMFPFAALDRLELYLALDRDAAVVNALRAVASARPEPRLTAHRWNLAEGWEAFEMPETAAEGFDVALLLKLVPVIARQSPELLDSRARTPAR